MKRRVERVVKALEQRFGVPQRGSRRNPLETLIGTILSQNTSDANSGRAYRNLRERFPTWEEVLVAKPEEIADAIRVGGLADQKAVRIKDILAWIKENHGELNLDFVCDMDPEDVINTLCKLKGVGIKTVSVMLCFACGKDVFPVDTHILRISKRLGLVPPRASAEKAHKVMAGLVPKGKAFSFHLNLLEFGRRICKAQNPRCQECPVSEYCLFVVGAIKT